MEVHGAYIPQDDTQSYLLRLYNVHVPSGARPFRDHHHLQFELALCKSGSGTYRTKERTYPIQAGDVFVFASHETHCITDVAESPQGLHMMNIQFEPRYLWGGRNDHFSPQHLRVCTNHADGFSNRLDPNNPSTARIATLLSEIEAEFFFRNVEYPLMVRSKICEILVLLLREQGYAEQGTTSTQTTGLLLVRRAIDYMSAHLQESISLQDVADAVAVTPNYLSALFPKTLGISLWSYLTEKRIQKAMSLLESGQRQNILQIALACGFNSTAAFNKAFRTYAGCTPKEYRKNGADYLT